MYILYKYYTPLFQLVTPFKVALYRGTWGVGFPEGILRSLKMGIKHTKYLIVLFVLVFLALIFYLVLQMGLLGWVIDIINVGFT